MSRLYYIAIKFLKNGPGGDLIRVDLIGFQVQFLEPDRCALTDIH